MRPNRKAWQMGRIMRNGDKTARLYTELDKTLRDAINHCRRNRVDDVITACYSAATICTRLIEQRCKEMRDALSEEQAEAIASNGEDGNGGDWNGMERT